MQWKSMWYVSVDINGKPWQTCMQGLGGWMVASLMSWSLSCRQSVLRQCPALRQLGNATSKGTLSLFTPQPTSTTLATPVVEEHCHDYKMRILCLPV